MQHLDEGTIHSWLDGALSADEAARVEAHVKECPECAAAVAEARGFIAGSSRILTALDNAPRGVIPAAAPRKRIDPFVWRVAATLMVVAVGTLVVVQDRGSDERPMSLSADSAALLPDSTSVSELSASTGSAVTAQTANTPTAAAPPVTASTGARAKERPKTAVGKAPSSALSKKVEVGDQLARRNADERRTLEAGGSSAAGQQSAASSGFAAAAPPARANALSSRLDGVAMDAATEPEPLKVVGTPRRMGMKVTLYEVVPGDTVTLTEPTMATFGAGVTTGANVAAKAGRTERSMAPQSVARPDAAAAAAPDSQRGAVLQSVPTSTPTPAPPAPVRQVQVANGITTISWTDATTGNMLKLSGRMSEARLQQIKIRIERERAAAAKKTP